MTLTCPKIGVVGLVTVNVVVPLTGTTATGAGDQVGVPHTKAGRAEPGAGGTLLRRAAHSGRQAGDVALPPSAMVTAPVKSGTAVVDDREVRAGTAEVAVAFDDLGDGQRAELADIGVGQGHSGRRPVTDGDVDGVTVEPVHT